MRYCRPTKAKAVAEFEQEVVQPVDQRPLQVAFGDRPVRLRKSRT
jgi:hypothetical protein